MKFLARYPSILAIAIAAWIMPSAFGQSGTLDTSFHPTATVTPGPPAGYVETNFNTVAAFSSGRGIVVQSDKGVTTRIVIGGNSFDNTFNHLCIVGVAPNGILDGGFGESNGITKRTLGVQDTFNDLALASDGKIIGGGYQNFQNVEKTVVARFTPIGLFD